MIEMLMTPLPKSESLQLNRTTELQMIRQMCNLDKVESSKGILKLYKSMNKIYIYYVYKN